MYFVYIIQSTLDSSYYIGYTSKSPYERLNQHNKGKSRYTKGHLPYKMIKYIELESKKVAKGLEVKFKLLKNPTKVIEIMGSPDFTNRD